MKTGWVGLVALLFLGGCGVENIAGRPERSDHRKAIVKRIEDREDLRIEEMVSQYHEARTSDGEKLEIRNKIIDVGLLTMDQYYSLFVDGFSAGKKSIDTFAEIGAMATNAAGAALGSATTKSVLHIVSGGLIASQTSISKNYFYEETIAALVKQMEAERRAVSVDIIRGTGLPISQYPLAAALTDLERYYFAGTVDGALAGIQRDAARKDNESGKEITKIRQDMATTVQYTDKAAAWITLNGIEKAREKTIAFLKANPAKADLLVASAVSQATPVLKPDQIAEIVPSNKRDAVRVAMKLDESERSTAVADILIGLESPQEKLNVAEAIVKALPSPQLRAFIGSFHEADILGIRTKE
jgi:hypothetical protein